MDENMVERTPNKLVGMYLKISAVLAVLCAISQTLLYFFCFDIDLQLYNNSPLTVVHGAFVLVAVLFALSAYFVFKKKELPTELAPCSKQLTFSAALAGFFILATLILSSLYALNGIESEALSGPLPIAVMVAAVPAACYFFMTALNPSPSKAPRALLGILAILWLILYSLLVYFHMDMSINSPIHVSNQLALIGAMLAVLEEVRIVLGGAKTARYIAFSLAAVILLTVSSIPTLALTFTMKIAITTDTIFYLAELSLALYFGFRIKDMCLATA